MERCHHLDKKEPSSVMDPHIHVTLDNPPLAEDDLKLVHSLADKEGAVEAPTDLTLADTHQIELPDLEWRHYDNPPIKLVVTNTGHTVNVGGKWECNRSYIRDGPFKGNYVFAQMHFHWGPTDDTGSEHSVENRKLPLEMHVVHINRMYRSQEMALKEKDGVAIVTYLFEIQEEDNMNIDPIISALPLVSLPQTSTQINPVSIGSILLQFQRDYLLYWGSVSSPSCQHVILWLTCRTPLGISSSQLSKFRQVRDINGQFMVKNFRETHPRRNHTLFHVSPSSKLESTLLSVYPGHAKVQEQLKQQEERLAEELSKTAAEEPPEEFLAEDTSDKTEPVASLDADAAAGAVSEAKDAEDSQVAAPAAEIASTTAGAVTAAPSAAQSDAPVTTHSTQPSEISDAVPSIRFSGAPVAAPSARPSGAPATAPSARQSGVPATAPSARQSGAPVALPSARPSVAQATAPSARPSGASAAVPSARPSGVPAAAPSARASRAPVAAPSARPSGVPVAAPSTQPSGASAAASIAQLTGTPIAVPSGRQSGELVIQPSVTTTAATTTVPTGTSAEGSGAEGPGSDADGILSKPSTVSTAKLYGAPSSTSSAKAESGLETDVALVAPSGGGTPQNISSTPSKAGVSVSKQPSKVATSRTPSIRGGPISGGKSPAPGASRQASGTPLAPSASRGGTSAPPKASSRGLLEQAQPNPDQRQPTAAVSKEAQTPQQKATKSDLRVTLSGAPLVAPPSNECTSREVPAAAPTASETKAPAGVSSGYPANDRSSCPPCPPCPAEVPLAAPREVSEQLPAESQLAEQQEALFQQLEEPIKEPVEEKVEEPVETVSDVPEEPALEVPIESAFEVPVEAEFEVPVEVASEVPVKAASKVSIETPLEQPGKVSPKEQLEAPQEIPASLKRSSVPPSETTSAVKATDGSAIPCPSDSTSVRGSRTPVQGICPICPACPPCPPCPSCPKCGTIITRNQLPSDSSQNTQDGQSLNPEQVSMRGSDAAESANQGQSAQSSNDGETTTKGQLPRTTSSEDFSVGLVKGRSAIPDEDDGECPPGFVKVTTIPDGEECPPGYIQVSALTIEEDEECPPGYVRASTLLAKGGKDFSYSRAKPAPSQPGTPRRGESSAYQKTAHQVPASKAGSQGSATLKKTPEHVSATASPIKQSEECPPGYVKVLSRSKTSSGGTVKPSRSRSSAEGTSDAPTGTPPPKVPSGASVGPQNGASRNQSREAIPPPHVRPSEECPPGTVRSTQPAGSSSRGPSERAHSWRSLQAPTAFAQESDPSQPSKVSSGAESANGYVPPGSQSKAGSESNSPIFVKPGEQCPPGYTKVVPSQTQAPLEGPVKTPKASHAQGLLQTPVYIKPGEECPSGYVSVTPSQDKSVLAPSKASEVQGRDVNAPLYVKLGEECPPGYVKAASSVGVTAQGKFHRDDANTPIYVTPEEECPPGYVRATPPQARTLPGGSTLLQASLEPSQTQGNEDRGPVYVKPGEECPPGYVKGTASKVGDTTRGQAKAPPRTPLYVRPGEECPPGYVKGTSPSAVAPTSALPGKPSRQSGVADAPIYVIPGDECPPGYVKASSTQGKSATALSAASQVKNSDANAPVYVRPNEECPPGYTELPASDVPDGVQPELEGGEDIAPLYVAPDEECPPGYVRASSAQGKSAALIGAAQMRGSNANAPVYVRPNEECPPGYTRLPTSGVPAGTQPDLEGGEDNAPLYVTAGEQCPPGYVKASPAQGKSAAALPGAARMRSSNANAPVYVRPNEECPPGYTRLPTPGVPAEVQPELEGGKYNAPLYVTPDEECPPGYVKTSSAQGKSDAPRPAAAQMESSNANVPVYVRPNEECPPGYTRLPTSGVPAGIPLQLESGEENAPVYVAPDGECPPGYVKSSSLRQTERSPSSVQTSYPLGIPPNAPSRIPLNQRGEADLEAAVAPVYVQPDEECPPGYDKVGPSQPRTRPDSNKPFSIGQNDQCPAGYVKVCKSKTGPDNPTREQTTSQAFSGRKSGSQPTNKVSSTKQRRGNESPHTVGLGKLPSIRGRSSSWGSRQNQGEIVSGVSQDTCVDNSSASPNIHLTPSNLSQRDFQDEPSYSAGTQSYRGNETSTEPAMKSSERVRKLNLSRASSSGRVAAEDDGDASETQKEPSRKSSSGRSNVRKSDTIRSFTDEATSDNRSLSYDDCQSHRSAVSVKFQDDTPYRGPLCVDTIAELAISERELMSEASVAHRSRSRLEVSSSSRFQVEEGDKVKLTVRINDRPHRMNGSARPSQQSLSRAVSSVKVASLSEVPDTAPEEGQEGPVEELLPPDEAPITDEAPTETALEEELVDSERRSGEGDELLMEADVQRKPVNESGEGAQPDEDVVMSMRETAFPSIGAMEPLSEAEKTPKTAVSAETRGLSIETEAALTEATHAKSKSADFETTAVEKDVVAVEEMTEARTSDIVPAKLASREESARKFKYFHPPVEPTKPAPIPVFFNSLAVTPAVILPASMEPVSMKAKRSPKYGSKINIPCGGKIPCHGKARKQWEAERAQWVQEESSKMMLQEANNALQALPDKVRSELVAEAARRRRSNRGLLSGPEYDILDKRGWPFEPYESETPLMSPIDIICQCVVDRQLAPLTFEGHFFPLARSMITNTGGTVEIRTVDPNCTPVLHGGPLMDDYIFESMHFHWSNGPGPECLGGTHRVNGRRFCMEGHMIHFKSEFKSKAEALKHDGGVCCVAFMLQIGGMENECFGLLSHELYRISAPQSKAGLDFNAMQTFASRACPFGYITYPGTLIGRQDRVNVIWIVYTDPIDICCQNVTQFQKLRPSSSTEIPTGCVPTFNVAKRPVLRACGPNI